MQAKQEEPRNIDEYVAGFPNALITKVVKVRLQANRERAEAKKKRKAAK